MPFLCLQVSQVSPLYLKFFHVHIPGHDCFSYVFINVKLNKVERDDIETRLKFTATSTSAFQKTWWTMDILPCLLCKHLARAV